MSVDFSTATEWLRDPKHLVFSMSRYKFVAKMLTGLDQVLEVGAGDGIQGKIVSQFVGKLTQTDKREWNPISGPYRFHVGFPGVIGFSFGYKKFDAIFALDVLEHINPADEDAFIRGIAASLNENGACIIGMPSLESQPYASPESKAEHVNCKTEHGLRELMQRHFQCVYLFGMNDEVVHTGFGPMCQYRFALCNTKHLHA